MTTSGKLTLDDIADTRAYERERADFRRAIIDLKKIRRIGVGPYITLTFENRATVRFQIQEMARVERIATDEGIQTELDTYNPLIPEPGQISATLFIELTSEELLREWLPKLVGVERAIELRFDGHVVVCTVDADHEKQLTRDEVTASVHYVNFAFTTEQVEAFAEAAQVALAVNHPDYGHQTTLGGPTVASLAMDLRG